MKSLVQVCTECGDPIKVCHGALCRNCRGAAIAAGRVGAFAQKILEKRAAKLVEMASSQVEKREEPPKVLVEVAAKQLAAAWGIRIGRA